MPNQKTKRKPNQNLPRSKCSLHLHRWSSQNPKKRRTPPSQLKRNLQSTRSKPSPSPRKRSKKLNQNRNRRSLRLKLTQIRSLSPKKAKLRRYRLLELFQMVWPLLYYLLI